MISQGTPGSPWCPASPPRSFSGKKRLESVNVARDVQADVPTRFETNFVTAVLFFGTGAFTAFSIDPSGLIASQEDLFSRSIWIGIYAVLFCLVAKRANAIWRLFLQQKLLIALLVWVFASVLWSDAPAITIRRATALLATTILGVYVAERFTLRQQMKMLLVTLSCIALLSLVAGLLFPKLAIMTGIDTAGAWRGIVGHKNMLGRLMTIFIALNIISSEFRKWKFLALPISALLLILSQSGTAILCLGVLLICMPGFWLLRQSRKVLMIGGSFFSVAMIVLITYGYFHAAEIGFAILERLGKTSTLSGRGPLWFLCLKYISQRPWLGYGYNAFWLGADGQYSSQIWKILHWEVPHAHNGFLELCLDVGVIGLALFLCVFVGALVQTIKAIKHARSQEAVWTILFLIFVFVGNISESGLLSGNNAFWIVFVSTIYSSHRLTTPLSVWETQPSQSVLGRARLQA
jgi:exopolysaccharide production protein ExoQ